jgi:hypothetical protein
MKVVSADSEKCSRRYEIFISITPFATRCQNEQATIPANKFKYCTEATGIKVKKSDSDLIDCSIMNATILEYSLFANAIEKCAIEVARHCSRHSAELGVTLFLCTHS